VCEMEYTRRFASSRHCDLLCLHDENVSFGLLANIVCDLANVLGYGAKY
jgi:hypothetical protein